VLPGGSYLLVPSQLLQDLVNKVDLLQATLVELRWPPVASTVLEEGEEAYNPEKEFVAPMTAHRGVSLATVFKDWLKDREGVAVTIHVARALSVEAGLINDADYGFWSGTRLEHRGGEAVDYSWRFNDKGAYTLSALLNLVVSDHEGILTAVDSAQRVRLAVDLAELGRIFDNSRGVGDGKFLTLNRNQKEGLCSTWEHAKG
jgi:hypothetical protein